MLKSNCRLRAGVTFAIRPSIDYHLMVNWKFAYKFISERSEQQIRSAPPLSWRQIASELLLKR